MSGLKGRFSLSQVGTCPIQMNVTTFCDTNKNKQCTGIIYILRILENVHYFPYQGAYFPDFYN